MYRSGDFPEDYEMWLRWMEAGVKILKLKKVILHWYDSDKRLTRTDQIYSNKAFSKIKAHYLHKYLLQHNTKNLEYVVWGASKLSRRQATYIERQGVQIAFYIDVNGKRQIEEPVLYYRDLPTAGKYFVLVYMKHNHIRKKIAEFLHSKNYTEGADYLFVA